MIVVVAFYAVLKVVPNEQNLKMKCIVDGQDCMMIVIVAVYAVVKVRSSEQNIRSNM